VVAVSLVVTDAITADLHGLRVVGMIAMAPGATYSYGFT
jgi:hypothetical protein